MSSTELLSSDQIAQAILATVQNCRDIVAAFADGRLPAPIHGVRSKRSDLRAAPGFARGRNLDVPARVLYTSRDVASTLSEMCGVHQGLLHSAGKGVPRQANRWIRVAMALLEFFEENPGSEQIAVAAIRSGKPGFRARSLLNRLRTARREMEQDAKALLNTAERCEQYSGSVLHPKCVVQR